MMRYSVKHRYEIFVKGGTFLSFAKNNCKNVGKNIIINLSGKYTPFMLAAHQNFLIMLQKYATDALKTSSKKLMQKTAEATGDFIDNKITDRVRKVSKNWKKNHSEKVIIEYDKETPKERYIPLEKDKEWVTDELRLKLYNNSIWETPEATGDFISNKIAKVSKKNQNKVVQRQLQTRMIK